MNRLGRMGVLAVLGVCAEAACGSDESPAASYPIDAGFERGVEPAGDAAEGGGPLPVEAVPVTETLHAAGLSAPLDIVRDEWGVPHIYGATLADVSFGQGYMVARDRFAQMELARHHVP